MPDAPPPKYGFPEDRVGASRLSKPITAPRGAQKPPEAPQRPESQTPSIVVVTAWYALQAFAIAGMAVISTLAAVNAILHWAV